MLGTTLFVPVLAAALGASPPAEKLTNRALFERTARGTVHIATLENGKARAAGSGWVIDAKRKWILTNFHLLPGGGKCLASFPQFANGRVVSDPAKYDLSKGIPGIVIDSDPRSDLTLVQLDRLPEDARQLEFASEAPHPGDLLHLVGNPSASAGWWVYTIGRTRALVKKVSTYSAKQTLECNVIEAQMDCNPGDSGSPVVNDTGEIVGVHSGSEKSAGIRGFAWHIDLAEVKTFYADVVALADSTKRPGADVYERRADRHRRKGNNDLAIADYNRSLQIDPKRGDAYRQRSRLHFLRRHYDAALSDGYRAVELLPEDPLTYNERGNAFYARQDYKRAAADYTEAIRRLPRDVVILVNRAATYVDMRQDELALKDFAEALRISPGYGRALEERGDLHRRRKDYKSAVRDYQAAVRVIGNNADLLARLGHALQDGGESGRAVDVYLQSLKLNDRQSVVWRSLGHARFNLKQWDQAVEAYSGAIKHDAADGQSWFYRAAAREEKGEVDEAQPEYARAAELGVEEAKGLKTFTSRLVRVHNKTDEPLKVSMIYEGQTKDGNWVRMPAAGAVEWTIQPGDPTYLLDNNEAIQARAIRIWAVGTKSGTTWENNKKRPLLVAEAPYKARKQDAHLHTFGE